MALVVFNLPTSRTSLIGRDRALAEIRSIETQPGMRLLTLTGVGGTGKTRLAMRLVEELAPRFPKRTWLVELASVNDADLIPMVVVSALGMREINRSDPTSALIAFLRAMPSLLLIDNCEHLIVASAVLVDTLLDACPELLVIATSREPLQVPGERQYRVRPLDTPDLVPMPAFDEIERSPAIELFVSRARDVLPSFELTTANADAVAQICTRLGGIPLALELAAARIPLLGLDEILTRLDDSFSLLNSGSRIAPTRHQTLRATLAWSEALLTDVERIVFQRLSVFAGAFQFTTAEKVCASETVSGFDVIDGLTGLVNKSLVIATPDDLAVWYHLLEPVRQYASAMLEQSAEADATRARHAEVFLSIVETAALELQGPKQGNWLRILERSQGNLRSALEWSQRSADSSLPLRLATSLVPFWIGHGHLTEGTRWLRRVLDRSENVDPALRMRAYIGAGRIAFHFEGADTPAYEQSEILQLKALELARAIDDRSGIAYASLELGKIYRLQRKLQRSKETLVESLESFRALDDELGLAIAQLNLGSTLGFLEEPDASRKLFRASIDALGTIGDLRQMAVAQILLSREERRNGEIASALKLGLGAIASHTSLGDRWFMSFDLMALAEALHDLGAMRESVTLFAAAHASADRLGSPVGGVTFKTFTENVEMLRHASWFKQAQSQGYSLNPLEAAAIAQATLDRQTNAYPGQTTNSASISLLTRREFEVARLIAEGQTDRQIADSLFVSVGTVGTHVHHILQKLELRSRLQVAAWLAEQEDGR